VIGQLLDFGFTSLDGLHNFCWNTDDRNYYFSINGGSMMNNGLCAGILGYKIGQNQAGHRIFIDFRGILLDFLAIYAKIENSVSMRRNIY
jgi:hypothetical protein